MFFVVFFLMFFCLCFYFCFCFCLRFCFCFCFNRKEVPVTAPLSSFVTATSFLFSGMPFLLLPFVTVSLSPSRWLCCFFS